MFRLSKSLKVIGTDTDRSATYDFLLVSRNYVTMALSRTVSEIKGDSCKIFLPFVFNAPRPLSGFPWNFVTAVRLEKLEWWLCQKVEKSDDCVHSFRHSTQVPALDRQTDRIGKTLSRSACIACWCAMKIIEKTSGNLIKFILCVIFIIIIIIVD